MSILQNRKDDEETKPNPLFSSGEFSGYKRELGDEEEEETVAVSTKRHTSLMVLKRKFSGEAFIN